MLVAKYEITVNIPDEQWQSWDPEKQKQMASLVVEALNPRAPEVELAIGNTIKQAIHTRGAEPPKIRIRITSQHAEIPGFNYGTDEEWSTQAVKAGVVPEILPPEDCS